MEQQHAASGDADAVPPDDLEDRRSELLRYVHRLTGDFDLAEDIVQEALIRYVAGGGTRSIRWPRSWLFRVATNLVRDHVQRAAVHHRWTILADEEPVPLPDRELERKQAVARVRSVLDHLSERDRALLILRQSGFRYREIAQVIDVRTESVPTLMGRALKRFRARYFMETGDDSSD